jgi:hypothetical protein
MKDAAFMRGTTCACLNALSALNTAPLRTVGR